MLANEGHTRASTWKLGSTWVGATPPCRAVASADAALVAPTHVLDEYRIRTVPVLAQYRDWPQSRPEGGQQ